jgi:hypothetical protein
MKHQIDRLLPGPPPAQQRTRISFDLILPAWGTLNTNSIASSTSFVPLGVVASRRRLEADKRDGAGMVLIVADPWRPLSVI